jgi:tRNA dimethylallyltransferase
MNNTLIVLLGPTGVGKTDISIEIATHLGCQIISADSRQFYKEMQKGTAVPSDDQLSLIKHHFIKFISVKEYYSSSLFERDVLKTLEEIFTIGSEALMAGGSGLYIDAVCKGTDDIPDVDPGVREKYINKFREEGIEGLRVALKLLDSKYYAKVDLKNPKRIIRALEICESTGKPYSSFLINRRAERDFKIVKIGLERSREELYRRIDLRVDKMIVDGLEKEAKSLFDLRNLNALNCVGYREFFDFFEGKIPQEKVAGLIKRNSRRYAKRQITWWTRDKEIMWFDPEKKDLIIEYIDEKIKNS